MRTFSYHNVFGVNCLLSKPNVSPRSQPCTTLRVLPEAYSVYVAISIVPLNIRLVNVKSSRSFRPIPDSLINASSMKLYFSNVVFATLLVLSASWKINFGDSYPDTSCWPKWILFFFSIRMRALGLMSKLQPPFRYIHFLVVVHNQLSLSLDL